MCNENCNETIKALQEENKMLREHNKLLQLENERLMNLEIEISRALSESDVSCWNKNNIKGAGYI